nr:hypothetical protein TetV2_00175 [Oceanusvirus sp.]
MPADSLKPLHLLQSNVDRLKKELEEAETKLAIAKNDLAAPADLSASDKQLLREYAWRAVQKTGDVSVSDNVSISTSSGYANISCECSLVLYCKPNSLFGLVSNQFDGDYSGGGTDEDETPEDCSAEAKDLTVSDLIDILIERDLDKVPVPEPPETQANCHHYCYCDYFRGNVEAMAGKLCDRVLQICREYLDQ